MIKFLKDLLFPRVCLNCGVLGSHICLYCQKKLKKIEKDTCFYCRRPSFLGLTHPLCKRKNGVDGNLSCFYYDDTLKRILKNIKYRLVREGFKELLLLIPQETINKLGRYDKLYHKLSVEPIPLHPVRQRQRGFNQADEIASFIISLFGFPRAQNLIRIRNTLPQSQQVRSSSRKKNVRRAFALSVKKTFTGQTILLVDDIVTSGATVAEAASVLKQQRAEKVFIFALAKG